MPGVGFCTEPGRYSMKKPVPFSFESHHHPVSGAMLVPLATTPLPVSEMVCGLPVPVDVTTTPPFKTPAAAGLNETLIVQVPPAFNVAPLHVVELTRKFELLLATVEIVTEPLFAVTVI